MYNSIVLGDCVEGMRSLPPDLVPCTVASPPYGALRHYHGNHQFDFEAAAAELWRITRPGGVVCWVVREEVVDGSESGEASEQRLFFRDLGFRLHQTIVMERYGSRARSPGRYGESLEYAFILAKGKPATVRLLRDRRNKTAGKLVTATHRYPDGSYRVQRYEVDEWGYRKAVWYFAQGMHVATDPVARLHQAPMPEAMAEDLILSYSREGDLIFDPFAGVATTAKMALLNHRNYFGYEINAIYHARGEERLRAARMEYLSRALRESAPPPKVPPPRQQTQRLLKCGTNDKLGAHVLSFSLPAPATCLGATETCLRDCYVLKHGSNHHWRKGAYEASYEASLRPDFADKIVAELSAWPGRPLRLHTSGDFYSEDYIRKWVEIARRCPGTVLWAYTRAWRIPGLLGSLQELASLPNVHLWFSLDNDTGFPPAVPGIRGCWLQVGHEEPPLPEAVSLIFRTKRDHLHQRRGPAKTVAGVMVCPVENGLHEQGTVTCESCKFCFTRR